MPGVRCISSSLVQAATHKAEKQRVELTPWDLELLPVGPIQRGLLFPKPKEKESGHGNTLIHHLKASLSQTLDYFPPLAGRLATTEHDDDDNKISFFIDSNNGGALFIHAEADGVTISDIVETLYVPPMVHSFFPVNNYEDLSSPLLGVQVTELVDGIIIGCTINHYVADGASFWHFFNSWSEISRGSVQYLSKLPVFRCSFLNSINYPIRISRVYVKELFNHQEASNSPPLKERVFHFSKQSIAKLKAQANAEIETNKISSFQALLSHLWRFIVRNKFLDPDEEMIIYLSVGARPRIQDFPGQYFGNAIKNCSVTMKAKELKEQGVGEIAWKMNNAIATQTEDEFKKALESWIASPKLLTMSMVENNALTISDSPWFDIYGNDFGWGRPIAVRRGSVNRFDGRITVFRGAEEGSIDIEACLLSETLDSMENDQEFMEFVSTFHF